MVNLEISRNTLTGKVWISNVTFVPTWVYRAANVAKRIHVIFPSQTCEFPPLPPFITPDQKLKLEQGYNDVKNHVPSVSSAIRMKSLSDYPTGKPAK